MKRRKFLAIAAGAVSLLTGSLLFQTSQWRIVYRKIKGRLRKNHSPQQPLSSSIAELPSYGEKVSVEMALNSRCCSDFDGDPDVFHWGMFDVGSQLSADQIRRISTLGGRCGLAHTGASVEANKNILTFSVDMATARNTRESCMIASGMQQQAVSLACSALGVGMVFSNLGLDGKEISSEKLGVIQMRIVSMKPSYRGSYWTALAPEKESPWLSGNLPDPCRNGTTSLVAALERMSSEKQEGTAATRDNISQILWAARGRTPHLYKSTPWGMTIPTWAGLQDITVVYVAAGTNIYKYVNWQKGRPTHALEPIKTAADLAGRLRSLFPPWNCFVILSTDDTYARGLWEVGYQLQNILVQSCTLGISYQTVVFRDDHREAFVGMSIEKPIAMIALKAVEGSV